MLKQVLELLSLPLGAEGSVEHPATHRLLPLMLVPLSLFVGLLSGIALYKSACPSGIGLLMGAGLALRDPLIFRDSNNSKCAGI